MEEIQFSHVSVLLHECIEALDIQENRTYVDCTTGGGGHSLEIAKRLPSSSRLICLDRDPDALKAAKQRLKDYLPKVTFCHTNYGRLGQVLDELQIDNLGGVLADLGCSSYQLDTPERGFSYMHDAPLDMRMDASDSDGLTAYQVVNTYSADQLKKILYNYGEEKFAPRIASAILEARAVAPIESTAQLADIIKDAIPSAARQGGHHPAKRSFQAIRIEVNGELNTITPVIKDAVSRMVPGGRIALISFHSLEDRIIKEGLAEMAKGCTCPRHLPICVCGNTPKVKILTKKPLLPSDAELEANPRSRSAKLRVAEKL